MEGGRGEAFDLLELGSRRFALLSHLTDGPVSKPTLVDALGVSRATVNRALRELEERHLVERAEGGHVLTPPGRLLFDALDGHLADLSTLDDASRLLAHLPPDAAVSLALIRGGEVHHATPPAPNRTLKTVRDYLRRADHCRGLIGEFASPTAAEFFRSRIEEGVSFELVLDDHVVSYLLAERREALRTYVDAGEVYTTDAIPYTLLITEDDAGNDACQFVVYDDDGGLAGLLVNETADAVAWAEDLFERYRAGATRLEEGP